MEKRKKRIRTLTIMAAVFAFSLAGAGLLFHLGIVQFNNPPRDRYPVRGIDVSEYQGEIDWALLASQDIEFAFIKATEGSHHIDPRFAYNWEHAAKTRLRIGAYHFFSFDSPGRTQAENFLSAVPKAEGMLPPVVDVELYDAYKRAPKPVEEVLPELDTLLHSLEKEYGVKPILYAIQEAYDLYLADRYAEYPLWIRGVFTSPPVNWWTFWQYSDRVVLPGYSGPERFIDMNLFRGTMEEFEDAF
jgi:lysozyme